jgi:hypothetical protein
MAGLCATTRRDGASFPHFVVARRSGTLSTARSSLLELGKTGPRRCHPGSISRPLADKHTRFASHPAVTGGWLKPLERCGLPGNSHTAGCTLIDVRTHSKGTKWGLPALAILVGTLPCIISLLRAQSAAAPAHPPAPGSGEISGPPQNPAFFSLSEVRPGMTGTAWTVFQGAAPEPMQVEILGVLRGARGPGQDLILAQLHGAKPEYTGVVDGMSGSPVYINGKLLGSLSYRIGQFAKDPIAGITPIEQMLEVRDMPLHDRADETQTVSAAFSPAPGASPSPSLADSLTAGDMTFQPMETPLVMSGFRPEAIRFWQQQTAGTTLEPVVAGGGMSGPGSSSGPGESASATLEPGSAVSMQLIRGDLEVAATCTVTYIDPRQLLACGHPVLGAGPVSLPMTTAEVVTTLASPLNAFKIINTGVTVGAFTEDRESAIRGIPGAKAQMIPVHIDIDAPYGPGKDGRHVNVEILDLPSLTPVAVQAVLFESLSETNEGSASLSYHLAGNIDVADFPPVPLDLWASAGDVAPAPLLLSLLAGERFARLYSNGARQGVVRQIHFHIQAVPRNVQVTLVQARVVSRDIVHAGDTVEVEATLRLWGQHERNVRIAVKLPARLAEGNLRLLVSDAATLDRTLLQPRVPAPPVDLETVLVEARNQHPADRIYVSLLAPEAQGEINGQTLTSVPLSLANAFEPLRSTKQAGLNGESAELAGEAPAGGVLSGYQILTVHIDPGGGLN